MHPSRRVLAPRLQGYLPVRTGFPGSWLGGPHPRIRSFTRRPTHMFRRHLIAALVLGAMATSLVGCNSGSTSSATSPIDLSPPQAPTNLHAVTDANIQRDWLVWDASASATVAGYEVYSSPTSSATGTLIATVDATSTDYLLPITNISSTE